MLQSMLACTKEDQKRLIPSRHCRMILRRNVEMFLDRVDVTGNEREDMEKESGGWVLQSRLIEGLFA